jgi:hypothetical protein
MEVDTPVHPRAQFYGNLRRWAWDSIILTSPPRPIRFTPEPVLGVSSLSLLKYLAFDEGPKLCMCDRCQRARLIQDGGQWHAGNTTAAPVGKGQQQRARQVLGNAGRSGFGERCGVRRWRGRR